MTQGAGWRREGKDLVRAVASGVIFGMPLLYTMEVWQHGATFRPVHLLAALGGILILNMGFCFFAGVRRHVSLAGSVSDGITSVGIGILLATVVLWLIGELDGSIGMEQAVGKILLEALVISVGINFTESRFGNGNGNGNGNGEGDGAEDEQDGAGKDDAVPDEHERQRKQLRQDLRDVAATIAGATVFAFNVAPTEEIVLIASRMAPWRQLVLLGASFALCYVILFASGFWRRPTHVEDSLFQSPFVETLTATAVALVVAAGLLAVVGPPDAMATTEVFVASIVTLGFPAVVGGAAGRLVV